MGRRLVQAWKSWAHPSPQLQKPMVTPGQAVSSAGRLKRGRPAQEPEEESQFSAPLVWLCLGKAEERKCVEERRGASAAKESLRDPSLGLGNRQQRAASPLLPHPTSRGQSEKDRSESWLLGGPLPSMEWQLWGLFPQSPSSKGEKWGGSSTRHQAALDPLGRSPQGCWALSGGLHG